MVKGQVVTALLYGGEEAPRRVVANKDKIIVLCSEDEYQLSLIENREPEGVGFPREDVIVIDSGAETTTDRARIKAD